MALVGNFMKRGKGSGSFARNKLKLASKYHIIGLS
jgi:hypothetical protein